ncbi:efflux RND transporter periplasmic adaptor subunit [bacterium]|nr:efflux RND transporter periplasmic adaptor subunit [bacterium]
MVLNNKKKSGKILFRAFWMILILAGVIGAISYATISKNFMEENLEDKPFYEVQEGPLTVSISVSGTIQAQDKVIIKSELEGSNAILTLVPEGTHVKKGDLLVELDASTLQDNLVEQEIRLKNAESAYISARENLEIVKNQAQSDIALAEQDYTFAKQDLAKYKEGEYPKELKSARAQITINEEELNRAQEELKWSKILFDKKYLSQTELRQDEIQAQKAQINLELSQDDLDLLREYTYKRQIATLESDVVQTRMALERTKLRASANIVQASAELHAKHSEFNRQTDILEKIKDQISKAKIYAPMDGLVVYATSVRMSWRGNDEPLEEGQTVREREELIHLPTTSSYVAEVKVHESSLEKIRLGLPVRITIDAIPGKSFVGHISKIAPLPDAQSVFMNPDLKVYKTEIEIDGDGEELRSGMSCRAEIIIDQFENTPYIPVVSVVRLGGKPAVYVAENNEWTPRTVTIGPDNNQLVQVEEGLKKGEKVLLAPPLGSQEGSDDNNGEALDPAKYREIPIEDSGQGPRGGPQGQRQGGRQRGQGDGPQGQMQGSRQGGQGGGQPGQGGVSDAQREQMRKQFENMSEEQKKTFRDRMRKQRESQNQNQNQ